MSTSSTNMQKFGGCGIFPGSFQSQPLSSFDHESMIRMGSKTFKLECGKASLWLKPLDHDVAEKNGRALWENFTSVITLTKHSPAPRARTPNIRCQHQGQT